MTYPPTLPNYDINIYDKVVIMRHPLTTVGRALANGFPLTEFGGFQGPFSVNSKYFNAFESRVMEDRGKNKNSSSILYNFAT